MYYTKYAAGQRISFFDVVDRAFNGLADRRVDVPKMQTVCRQWVGDHRKNLRNFEDLCSATAPAHDRGYDGIFHDGVNTRRCPAFLTPSRLVGFDWPQISVKTKDGSCDDISFIPPFRDGERTRAIGINKKRPVFVPDNLVRLLIDVAVFACRCPHDIRIVRQ